MVGKITREVEGGAPLGSREQADVENQLQRARDETAETRKERDELLREIDDLKAQKEGLQNDAARDKAGRRGDRN